MNKVIITGCLGADLIEHDGNILNIQNSVEKNNQGKIKKERNCYEQN